MVYNLTKVPAFGFESQNIKAVDAERDILERSFDALVVFNKMRAESKYKRVMTDSEAETAFLNLLAKNKKVETYSRNQFFVDKCKTFPKIDKRKKIIAYVPVIGTFLGLYRLFMMTTKNGHNFSKMNILRGIIETLSLGILLLPADLVVTSYRKHKWKEMQETV